MASIQPIGWDDDYEIMPGGCLDRGVENGGADAAIVLSSYDEPDMYQCIIEVEKDEVVTIGNNQERPANVPPDIPETLSTGVIKYTAIESTEVCDLINSTAPYYGIPIIYRFHKYEILYEEVEGDIPNWWKLKTTNREVYTWILYFKCNDEPIAPPGWEWDENKRPKPVCPSEFEILHNVEFDSLVSDIEATNWESSAVVFNTTSSSDYAGNVAHFGDTTCEYIKQPVTTDNGEYRYNPTMTYKIEIPYIDIRNATADSTIVINVGGHVDVYDINRIRSVFDLGNTGTEDVYSFQTGEEVATIEVPVPSVTPGTYAIAEIWQMGNIVVEVSKFGITGYIPCEQTGLFNIPAENAGITCTPEEKDITEYLWKQDLYRRKIVTFDTDIQGLVPQYLDKILVSHSALQWGEAGEVAIINGDIITLSDKLVDMVSTKTIVFRKIDGSISGAYGVAVIDEYNIEVSGVPTWVAPGILYTIQDMGSAQEFLVTSVVPNGETVKVECVEYVEEIYK